MIRDSARSGQNVRSRFSAIKNLAYDHKRPTFRDCTCAHRSVAIFTSLPELLTTSVEKTGGVFSNPETASVSRPRPFRTIIFGASVGRHRSC